MFNIPPMQYFTFPVDCKVGEWMAWGECSATCGDGNKRRTREVVQQPGYGGNECPNLEETDRCNMTRCPGALWRFGLLIFTTKSSNTPLPPRVWFKTIIFPFFLHTSLIYIWVRFLRTGKMSNMWHFFFNFWKLKKVPQIAHFPRPGESDPYVKLKFGKNFTFLKK